MENSLYNILCIDCTECTTLRAGYLLVWRARAYQQELIGIPNSTNLVELTYVSRANVMNLPQQIHTLDYIEVHQWRNWNFDNCSYVTINIGKLQPTTITKGEGWGDFAFNHRAYNDVTAFRVELDPVYPRKLTAFWCFHHAALQCPLCWTISILSLAYSIGLLHQLDNYFNWIISLFVTSLCPSTVGVFSMFLWISFIKTGDRTVESNECMFIINNVCF